MIIRPRQFSEAWIGGALAASYLLFSAIFWAYPFIWLMILSVTKWRFFDAPTFVGLHNFLFVLADPEFWGGVGNVLRFFVIFFPIVMAGSLAFALGLKHIGRGKTFIALSFLLANVSSGVAFSLVFKKIFSSTGPLNIFLFDHLGLRIAWMSDPNLQCSLLRWSWRGNLSAITGSSCTRVWRPYRARSPTRHCWITRRRWKRLIFITLPMVNAQVMMVLIFTILVSFAIFTEPYLITGGGPEDSTSMPQMIIYETAFRRLQPSHAAMMSIVLSAISFALVKAARRAFEREVKLA